MNLAPVLRRAARALAWSGLLVAPLAAQNVLFTDLDGKFVAVRKARFNNPYVEMDGKLAVADGRKYVLQKAPEYRPEFIDVRNLEVKSRYLNVTGSEINHEFILGAQLKTPYRLDDVFIVLELNTERAGKVLFLQEVGDLTPNDSKTISVTVPVNGGLGEGKYKFHLFAGGLEVLTTKMTPEFRDRVLDEMTRKRIAGVQDAEPKPFTGPAPEYPRALLKSGATGHVVIALRIGANGQTHDPKVVSATDPAFGEAALTAVRLWRFLPQVKDGRPVETTVNLPPDFSPPGKQT